VKKTQITFEELENQNPEMYFQGILTTNEFERLETLVDNSDWKISWEELSKEGVVKISSEQWRVELIYWEWNLALEETTLTSLRKIKSISWYLLCPRTLEDLWELEEVSNRLEIRNAPIKSLWKLREVCWYLVCINLHALEDLWNLKKVHQDLYLSNCSHLESLGNVEKVWANLICEDSKWLKSLWALKIVKGRVKFKRISIKSLGKIKKINGALLCNNLKTLEDLWELEEVWWQMEIKWTSLKSLWKLKKVKYNFHCDNIATLEDLWELEEVHGYFSISWTKVKSLGKLQVVYGSMYCVNLQTLEDLWYLEEVSASLNISGTSVESLGKLKKVRASLICENMKKLKDLWDIETVGVLNIQWVNVDFQMKIMEKYRNKELEIIRYIHFWWKVYWIEKLLEEETILWDLSIENKEIQNLGKIKKIRGDLYLINTSIYMKIKTLWDFEKGRLEVKKIAVDNWIREVVEKVFQDNKFSFNSFIKVFGDKLSALEWSNYIIALELLKIEYKEKLEEIKKRGQIIIERNRWKDIKDKDKKKIRNEIKALGNELSEL